MRRARTAQWHRLCSAMANSSWYPPPFDEPHFEYTAGTKRQARQLCRATSAMLPRSMASAAVRGLAGVSHETIYRSLIQHAPHIGKQTGEMVVEACRGRPVDDAVVP